MKAIWNIFFSYILILFLVLFSNGASAQIEAIHFNAGFNSSNDVVKLNTK